MDFATADKLELIAYCRDHLGHRERFLQALSLSRLRQIATSGTRYIPPTGGNPQPIAPVTEPVKPAAPANGDRLSGFVEELAQAVTERIKPDFMAWVDVQPREVVLTLDLGNVVKSFDLGLAHYNQALAIKRLLARRNVYAFGPAGSGKTTGAFKAYKVLCEHHGREIGFYPMSGWETMQAHDLIGYLNPMDGNRLVRTPFREAWEHGGLFFIDECDKVPGLITILNMALDSDLCAFPDGQIKRHADFYFMGGGNTVGLGATDEYVSSLTMDAATRNRLCFIEWKYDEALELAAAGADQVAWVKHVQKLRKALNSLGASAPKVIASPRASIAGAGDLRLDPTEPWQLLEEQYIWQYSVSADDKAKVYAAMEHC